MAAEDIDRLAAHCFEAIRAGWRLPEEGRWVIVKFLRESKNPGISKEAIDAIATDKPVPPDEREKIATFLEAWRKKEVVDKARDKSEQQRISKSVVSSLYGEKPNVQCKAMLDFLDAMKAFIVSASSTVRPSEPVEERRPKRSLPTHFSAHTDTRGEVVRVVAENGDPVTYLIERDKNGVQKAVTYRQEGKRQIEFTVRAKPEPNKI